jgi:DNA-binding MarR family transcriptional regulator
MDEYTANLLGALSVGCCDVQLSAVSDLELPPAELAALLAVHSRPGSTVGDISLTAGLTHSGAVRAVDRLSEAGWVERRTGARDRRTVAVHCTREGRARARRALSLRLAALQNAARELSGSELAALRTIARKLLGSLPQSRPDAWRICRMCDHGICRGASCPVGSAVP